VTGASKQQLMVVLGRYVECADGIVRTQGAYLEGAVEVASDVTTRQHEAAQRALGVRRSGVDENAVAVLRSINPLANRRCGITALERNRRQ